MVSIRCGILRLAFFVCCVANASAADVLLPTPEPAASRAADPLLDASPKVTLAESPWRSDITFGLPTALRVQRRIGESNAWFEAGAGVYVVIPTVFVGVRADADVFASRSNALCVRPGIDVYYGFPISYRSSGWHSRDRTENTKSIGVIALDFDMLWRHRFGERIHGQFGVKLGCGAGFADGFWAPIPIAGLIAGFSY